CQKSGSIESYVINWHTDIFLESPMTGESEPQEPDGG
ncbi:unnamed protein product, partial [marine sediment metagenome]